MANDIRFLQGNEVVAEAALYAGLDFFAGYPITPSTEIAETMARQLPEKGGKFIQMEDEIASLCAIIGASLTGHKVMTGCGCSVAWTADMTSSRTPGSNLRDAREFLTAL